MKSAEVQKSYEKPDKAVKVIQARVPLCEKFVCMIVYKVIDKVIILVVLLSVQCYTSATHTQTAFVINLHCTRKMSSH